MREVADGVQPTANHPAVTVLAPPDERSVGVLAFPGRTVVSADLPDVWVRSWLPLDDLSAPLGPPFLLLLTAVTGRLADNLDIVLVARAHGRPRGMDLTDVSGTDHPRLVRACAHRTDVRAWSCPGGLVVLGRGVAGRWEVSVEVDAPLRGFGLGRSLFAAALGLLPDGDPVWAQVAPGNAASVRSALGAGYRPVGAEVLLVPDPAATETDPFAWFTESPGEPSQEIEAGPIMTDRVQ